MSALSPEALVALGGIADHQRLRTSRIASILGNRLGSSALDYAVAHHLLEGAEHAARARDADRLAWYRRTSVRDLTRLSAGPHIVLNPRTADMLRSEISETAYYLVCPDTSPAPPEVLGLVRAATASATEHGFGTLLTQHAPVICLLNRRRRGEGRSPSASRRRGTASCDRRLGRQVQVRHAEHVGPAPEQEIQAGSRSLSPAFSGVSSPRATAPPQVGTLLAALRATTAQ